MVRGGKRPSRASTSAPMARSAAPPPAPPAARRIDSSPSSVHVRPGWPASHPGSSRSSVPEFCTFSRPPVASSGARRPTPRTSTEPPPSSSTPAPRLRSAARVADRVRRLQVVAHHHGLVRHRGEQRGAVGDRLVRGRRVGALQRPRRGEPRVAAHSSATGKPSSPISSAARAACRPPRSTASSSRCACPRRAPAPCPRCSPLPCPVPAPPGRRYRGGSAR